VTVDELIFSTKLLGDLETLQARIRAAVAQEDGKELVAISDEFMGYADDLADLGHALGGKR
jgi:hypothetical protein